MKTFFRLMALGIAFIAPQLCTAQAPAGAPAGATALCNDGTYSKLTSKMAACVGHKGVKTWFGPAPASSAKPTTTTPATSGYTSTKTPPPATKPTPPTTTTPTTTPTPPAGSTSKPPTPPVPPTSTATTKPPSGGSSAAPAPGGGPNLVWENTGGSKVYHCPGTTYYGKTKSGKYVTEAQAKADGYHPNGGKPCFK